MNDFKIQAAAYRKHIEKNPADKARAYLERKIKMFDFLADLEKSDIQELYNTGIFNEITKAYCKVSAKNINLSNKQSEELISEINYLHDTATASEVLNRA